MLGLAYKPGTGVVEESAGIALAGLAGGAGYDVHVYDPVVTDAAQPALGRRGHRCASSAEVFERCDVVVIATPWPEFARASRSKR